MRRVRSLLVQAAIAALAITGVPSTVGSPDLVIRDVAVVDTRTGKLIDSRDVVITGDRIVSVELAKAAMYDKGITLINGRGKLLIPGRWDTEVHLSWATESALPLLVANGVTDVRDMGSKLDQIEDWRGRISTGLVASRALHPLC